MWLPMTIYLADSKLSLDELKVIHKKLKQKPKLKHFGQTNLSQNLPKLFYISNFLLLLASLLKLFESQVVLLMHLFYNKIKGNQENNFIINILNLCFDPSGS